MLLVIVSVALGISTAITLHLLVQRRKRLVQPRRQPPRMSVAMAPQLMTRPTVALASPKGFPRRRTSSFSVGGLGAQTAEHPVTCPSCRREYRGLERYCARDGRKLAVGQALSLRGSGNACLACHRAFDADEAICPHDGVALVPYAVYAERRKGELGAAGVVARICPLCGAKDDLHARFCTRDGAAMLVIN